MSRLRSVRPVAALVAAAVLGGVVAVGAVALLGGLDQTHDRRHGDRGSTIVEARAGVRRRDDGERDLRARVVRRRARSTPRTDSTSSSGRPTPFGGQDSALGSGFVIDKSGHIVTNYHVVRDAGEVTVSFSNRDTVKAEVVGTDPSTDLAVLRVETAASALTPLSLGNSDVVQVGDPVVAIGNPFGLDRDCDVGHRQRAPAPHHRAQPLHDRPRHPDRRPDQPGQLGWPAPQRARPGDRRQHADRDRTRERARPATSASASRSRRTPSRTSSRRSCAPGASTTRISASAARPCTEDVAETYNLPVEAGVLVESVTNDSGADKAGLEGGETEVVVAGETLRPRAATSSSPSTARRSPPSKSFATRSPAHKPGDKVKLVIYRDANKSSVTVTLGRQPPSPQG